jgi:DNA-binding transcriptional MerR regulator
MFTTPTRPAVNAPQSPLERQLIIDYLAEKGFRLEEIKSLPSELAKELMTGACTNASLKLAEIEAHSLFRRKIQFED